jgi:voltage-gated sodium channel
MHARDQEAKDEKQAKQAQKDNTKNQERRRLTIDEQNRQIHLKNCLQKLFYGAEAEVTPYLEHSHWLARSYQHFSDACEEIKSNRYFAIFMAVVILVLGLFSGIDADTTISNQRTFQRVNSVFSALALLIFWVELIINVAAHRFTPHHFLFKNGKISKPNLKGWFDFLIVIASTFGVSQMILLTVLRLLLVFRILPMFPRMGVPVDALIKSFQSLAYIGIITLVVIFNFSVLGVELFKINDPFHFGNLHISMITLYRCATLEDWTDVMYINMYGCAEGAYETDIKEESLCQQSEPQGGISAAYFISFIVIGALVVLNLFIGIVCLGMEHALEAVEDKENAKADIEQVKQMHHMSDEDLKLYQSAFRSIDHDLSGVIDAVEFRKAMVLSGPAIIRIIIFGCSRQLKILCIQIRNRNLQRASSCPPVAGRPCFYRYARGKNNCDPR